MLHPPGPRRRAVISRPEWALIKQTADMPVQRSLNWLMWRAARGCYWIADQVSEDGNTTSAPFARLGHWCE